MQTSSPWVTAAVCSVNSPLTCPCTSPRSHFFFSDVIRVPDISKEAAPHRDAPVTMLHCGCNGVLGIIHTTLTPNMTSWVTATESRLTVSKEVQFGSLCSEFRVRWSYGDDCCSCCFRVVLRLLVSLSLSGSLVWECVVESYGEMISYGSMNLQITELAALTCL